MRTLPIRVVFTMTREDVVRGYWETVGRPWSFVAVPVTLLGTGALVWLQTDHGRPPAVALLQASFVPLVVLTLAMYLFVLLPRKAFDRLPAAVRRAETEVLFGEERLSYVRPSGSAEWADWRWFVETRNYFALYPKAAPPGQSVTLIPKRAFVSAQDLADFRELLARKVTAWSRRSRG
jgi:hypothetical protein